MNNPGQAFGRPDFSGYGHPSLIEQAKQEWESAVDVVPQIICVVDAEGKILRVNRTAEYWGPYAVDEAGGLTLHQFLHPGCTHHHCSLRRFWSRARRELSGDSGASYEADDPILQRHVDIIVRPAQPRRSRNGCKVFATVVINDVTENHRKAMQIEQKNAALDAQVRMSNIQLQQACNQLHELSSRLVDIQEQERKRVASELHDGIGQTLSLLKFGIDDLRRGLTAAPLGETHDRLALLGGKVSGAIEELRVITMDLRPPILDDFGILATISWFIREFEQVYRDIVISQEIDVRENQVPCTLRTPIYRILQEAMNNIAKHACTASVVIRLARQANMLELCIEDDGPGFDMQRVMASTDFDKGHGLLSMRDRAMLSGGECRITSQPGAGTTVRVSWQVAG